MQGSVGAFPYLQQGPQGRYEESNRSRAMRILHQELMIKENATLYVDAFALHKVGDPFKKHSAALRIAMPL